ncbi:MAG: hypothetical protein PHU21_00015 [Elusimicrobia bacterium]|jgi:hypothetical protein|nr:hypothetical protein [Elusimicrobiota bacterium]
MKVLRIESMKFHAGCWKKAGPVLKKIKSLGQAAGFPKVKVYATVSGGDAMHTVHMVSEWNSLSAMESMEAKMNGKKDLMGAMEKLADVVDSSHVTLFKDISGKGI